MKSSLLFLAILLVSFLSCNKDVATGGGIFGFETFEEALDQIGDYAYANSPTEASFNIAIDYSATKPEGVRDRYIFRYEENGERSDVGIIGYRI